MSIVLLILKIIGIILLVLLGILVLTAVSLLLVPLRYAAVGEIEEKATLDICLHWLCSVVRFRYTIVNGEKRCVFRICGIPVFRIPADRRRRKHKKKKTAPSDEAAYKPSGQPEGEGQTEEPEHTENEETQIREPEQTGDQEEQITEPGQTGDQEEQITESGQTGEKKKQTKEPEHTGNDREAAGKKGRIRQLWQKGAGLKRAVTDENNRAVLRLLQKELKYILSHCRVRRCQADLTYCLADPSLTGQLLALISLMPVVYRKGVKIQPDFESEEFYVRGSLKLKGHIRLLHPLRSGIHIWKNQNIKKIIRRLFN